jgi:hypothetical protein
MRPRREDRADSCTLSTSALLLIKQNFPRAFRGNDSKILLFVPLRVRRRWGNAVRHEFFDEGLSGARFRTPARSFAERLRQKKMFGGLPPIRN